MKMGMEMHLKCVHKSTSLIIILNTIIKIFSEDSIIVKCMQFTLWCIHGDNVYKMSREEIVCDFERSSNHVVYNFKMCDSQTLCRIFSLHCESFYGCEILNYNMSYMSNLYVSWRKIIRHIFRLPQRTHKVQLGPRYEVVSDIGNCNCSSRLQTVYIYLQFFT